MRAKKTRFSPAVRPLISAIAETTFARAFFRFMTVSFLLTVASSPVLTTTPALCAEIPQKGGTLPSFKLPSPASESDRTYLGLKAPDFTLKEIEGQLLIVEIIGVYCPFCYEQAPLFSKLYARLNRKNLSGKVKMLAIAAGGTTQEAEYLRKNGSYEFPVVQDESFAVHKLLGEPRTPYTFLVSRDGKVLYAHPNILEDIDGFLQMIEEQLK